MDYKKMLSLAALMAAALMAFAGTASATTLTSPKGTVYTASGTGEAEGAGGIVLTSAFGGFGSITCKKATYSGKVEFHGVGVTAGGKVASLAFTECTGGTPTSPIAKPGTLEVHSTTTAGNGTITSNGAEVIVHNTAVGTCVFVTNNTDLGVLTGSNITKGNATVDVNAKIVTNGANPFCGSTSTLEGAIKITSPITLEVD